MRWKALPTPQLKGHWVTAPISQKNNQTGRPSKFIWIYAILLCLAGRDALAEAENSKFGKEAGELRRMESSFAYCHMWAKWHISVVRLASWNWRGTSVSRVGSSCSPRMEPLGFRFWGAILGTFAIWVREGFNNPSHGNCPWRGGEYPPLSVNFFPLTFRQRTVR